MGKLESLWMIETPVSLCAVTMRRKSGRGVTVDEDMRCYLKVGCR